ncbi:hypothetical protein [Brumicola pallidula]|uniref:Uncharacterized protein n=1 Tax=Brumicola pallidula DSM 14239 = ACAM 615 TaxID=1121922 RepID=K6Z185_9ALTE|nr:hypothetical protein [Glaciecola pallidula]GAC29956.1 hypothetical protein GPAL_3105 [Glaciecola pallidula DSM 14239 = ACAM 615]
MQENPLLIEWATLQNQFDAFEKLSLVIKLVAILIAALFVFELKQPEIILVLNSICWGQDAIWKTFQSRFADRLLKIESDLSSTSNSGHIQFNTAWDLKPRGQVSLVSEYLRHLVKPTIVFPHLILLCLGMYVVLFNSR